MEDDFVKLTSETQYIESKDRERVPNVERFIMYVFEDEKMYFFTKVLPILLYLTSEYL